LSTKELSEKTLAFGSEKLVRLATLGNDILDRNPGVLLSVPGSLVVVLTAAKLLDEDFFALF
jgi:hypothetical protein